MAIEKLCPVCMKELPNAEALRKHMLADHPTDPITFKKYPDIAKARSNDQITTPIDRIERWFDKKNDSDDKIRIKMLEDSMDFFYKRLPEITNPNYNPFTGVRPLNSGVQQPPVMEDDFDKLLGRMMKVLMIKQLMGGNEGSFLSQFMKMDEFLDNRYAKDEDNSSDPMAKMIGELISNQFLKKKSMNNPVEVSMGPAGIAQPTQTGVNNNMRLPQEAELLAMSDSDILILLKKDTSFQQFLNYIKQGMLTQDLSYKNLLGIYPNFPRDRFDHIWELIQIEVGNSNPQSG